MSELIQADLLKWLRDNQWLVQNGYIPKVHAVFGDPPYFLGSIAKRFGSANAAPAKYGRDGSFSRLTGRQNFKKCISNFFLDPIIAQTNDRDTAFGQDFVPFRIKIDAATVFMDSIRVEFNNQISILEEKIDDKCSVIGLENVLVDIGDAKFREFLGGIYFRLGKIETVPACIGKCTCFSKRRDAIVRIGVRFCYDSFGDSERSSDVVTAPRTEIDAVLSLDLSERTGKLLPADGANKVNLRALLLCSQLIRTGSGTGGFSSPLKPSYVGEINRATDGTISLNFFAHKELLETINNPIISQTGFMGSVWDGFDDVWQYQAWVTEWATLLLDYVYPGAVLAMFGGTRTVHRLVAGLEDAGWQPFDQIQMIFSTGFPKSTSLSKLIDQHLGVERTEVIGINTNGSGASPTKIDNHKRGDTGVGMLSGEGKTFAVTAPATIDAARFEGYKGLLKPSFEPVVLARAPRGNYSFAELALKFGTGSLNIDGCRIPTGDELVRPPIKQYDNTVYGHGLGSGTQTEPGGRYPANLGLVCTCEGEQHEPDCPVRLLDEQSGYLPPGGDLSGNEPGEPMVNVYNGRLGRKQWSGYKDGGGGASRFLYTVKPGRFEREAGLDDFPSVKVDDGRKTAIDNPFQRGGKPALRPRADLSPEKRAWLDAELKRRGIE